MIKLKKGSKLPRYLMCPYFLLDFRLNSTAIGVYLLLYDRARLSMSNDDWIDEDGCVFLVYTVRQLADEIGRSERRVTAALTVLEKSGLIIRHHTEKSKANIFYVMIPTPDDGVRSGRKQRKYTDESVSMMQTKSSGICGRSRQVIQDDIVREIQTESSGTYGRDRPPSNNYITRTIDSEQYSQNTRIGYGKYKNVFLTCEEYARLTKSFPSLARIIDKMSAYLASNGKTYANYEIALRTWAAREPQSYENVSYEHKEDESL